MVRYKGQEIRLTHKEFELFRYMVERPGRVLTRERLLERVWGWEKDIDARSIDAHIRRLRLKLGDGPQPRRDGRRPRLPLREVARYRFRPTPNWSPLRTGRPFFQITSTTFSLWTAAPVSSRRAPPRWPWS